MRRQGDPPHWEHDPEVRECIDCGAGYDLAMQTYYGPRCPKCHDKHRGDEDEGEQ